MDRRRRARTAAKSGFPRAGSPHSGSRVGRCAAGAAGRVGVAMSPFRRTVLLLLCFFVFVLSPLFAATVSAQPAYRERQERLSAQSGESSPPRRKRINIYDPKSIDQYTGKRAATENEAILDSVRRGNRPESGYSTTFRMFTVLVLLAILGAAFGTYYANRYIWNRERKDSYDDDRELFHNLCHLHDIDRKGQKFLRNFASEMEVDDPLLLFIEPHFFDMAIADPAYADNRSLLIRLRVRLFGSVDAEDKETPGGRARLPIEIAAQTGLQPSADTGETKIEPQDETPNAPSGALSNTATKNTSPRGESTVYYPQSNTMGSSGTGSVVSRFQSRSEQQGGPAVHGASSKSAPRSPGRSGALVLSGNLLSGMPPGGDVLLGNGFSASLGEVLLELTEKIRGGAQNLRERIRDLAKRHHPLRDTLSYRPPKSPVSLDETLVSEPESARTRKNIDLGPRRSPSVATLLEPESKIEPHSKDTANRDATRSEDIVFLEELLDNC